MLSTPLPELPANATAAPERDVSRRPGWPFPELTDQQRVERFHFEIAARRGELRKIPTCFGDLL
jgi:hypothetical protein